MRKLFYAALVAVLPAVALSHYYFLRPYTDPAPSTTTVTGAPSAPTVVSTWRCITAAGATIPNGGPFSTKAAAEAPCGVAVAGDGVTRYLEESIATTANVPTTTTVRTRREEVLGGTTLKVSDAHAQIIGMTGGSLSPTPDTIPTAFSFTDQTNVSTSATITSAAITVSGINAATPISVSGGTYDINGSGSFTSSGGTVSNGNTVRARHTASASNSTATNTVVTIGGVSDTFTSTTIAGGVTPLFSDDFEDGYGNSTPGWYGTGVEPTRQASCGKDSSWGLRFHYGAGGDGWSEVRFNLGATYPEIWFVFDMKLPSNWVHRRENNTDANNKFLYVWNGSDGNYSGPSSMTWGFEYWSHTSGNSYTSLRLFGSGYDSHDWGYTSTNFFTSADINVWRHWKVRMRNSTSAGSPNGVAQIWKDGVLIGNDTAVDNFVSGITGMTRGYLLGYANSGFAQDTDVCVDNFMFHTSDPEA